MTNLWTLEKYGRRVELCKVAGEGYPPDVPRNPSLGISTRDRCRAFPIRDDVKACLRQLHLQERKLEVDERFAPLAPIKRIGLMQLG